MINPFDNNEIAPKKNLRQIPSLNINPTIQDKLDSLPLDASYQNEFQVNQDEGPYQPDPAKPIPSFGETFKHSAERTVTDIFQQPELNPLNDNITEGWNAASDPGFFVGVQEKNQGYVAAATSPNDAYFRRLNAIQKQDEDEFFDNGSMLAKFLGGFVDTLPFAMIPLGQSLKYATIGKGVYESMLAAAPGMSIGSLLHEGTINAHEIGGSIEQTLKDTYIDTIAGLAFVGGTSALGHGFDALKLFDARSVLKMHYDGMVPEIRVDNDGKVLGYVATPMQGESVSAAKVDDAQRFLDSTFAKNGLFAIPYIGGLLGKGAATYNPIMRGLMSPFETIRGFTDRTASHSLITEGIQAGREKPEDFETLMGIVQAQNRRFYDTMGVLLDRRNDIDAKSRVGRLADRTRKRWQDEGYIAAEKFGEEIKQVMLSGNSHENGAVNEAAALTKQYLDDTWNLYRETYNLPKDWMPPPTADGYFPRIYNVGLMLERPGDWNDMWVGWWKKADQDITTHMKPIEDFKYQLDVMKQEHDALIKNKSSNDEDIEASSKELAAAQRKHRKMKEDLADRIKSDKTLFLHADDHAALTGTESRKLKNIMKPLRQATKAHDAHKVTVDKLKQQEFFIKNKINAVKNKEKGQALQADLEKLQAEIETQKVELQRLKNERDNEELKLQDAASDKKISQRFYDRIPNSNLVKFKDANNLLKFRDRFESEFHMNQQAEALRSTIANQTPEDTLNQVMGRYIGSASETPTLKRSQMIPDEILQSNKFLSNNIPNVVANYRNALQRKIIMKQVFGDVTIDGGIAPIAERLTNEFKMKESAILKNKELTENKQKSQLRKLNKDFNDAKEYLQLSHDRMMGRTRGSKKMRDFNRLMRLWTVSTRLGSVPLTMTTDLAANIYKHGFWPSVRDGLLPALRNLVTRDSKELYENAAHANLALSHILAAYNDRDWGGITMEHVPLTGTLGNVMEHAAHISGNIAMTNQLDNFLQRISANIVQSKIMKYMMDFEKGILKQKDKEKLLKYGLDPETWSDRFLKGWRERGEDGNGLGGFQSRFWEWSDAEASNKMSRTIYKGVSDTIIRKGMMDSPFSTDDPIIGMIWFLHGWTSAALTRYLAPLMQRPDADHLIGLTAMMTAGALVAPMRKLSRGESPLDDETSMFWDAMQDSGILSPITDLIENANIVTNGRILRGISNDRYRQRSNLGASLGPVAGVGQDVFRMIGMMLDGRLNENDVKKAARLIPAIQPWYLRGLQNKMIEGLGLPRTAAEARDGSGNAYNYGV